MEGFTLLGFALFLVTTGMFLTLCVGAWAFGTWLGGRPSVIRRMEKR